MTTIVLLLAIWALLVAIGTSRQTRRTLRAWQLALESLKAAADQQRDQSTTQEVRFSLPPTRAVPTCPCTCHPLPTRRS
jgi:hypothetical protein